MAPYIFLDAGPLGLACKGDHNPKAIQCRSWVEGLREKGYIVLISEVSDYEVRREFIRIQAWDMIAKLDALSATSLLRITRPAMLKAAEFWSLLRNQGMSTADDKELDCDAILAAQAVTAAQPGDTIIIATDNIGHLNRFPGVTARPWEYIS